MSKNDFILQFEHQLVRDLTRVESLLDGDDLSNARRELLARDHRRIEAAIERLKTGTYGTCCDCGETIDKDSLRQDPATPFCEDCQEGRMAA